MGAAVYTDDDDGWFPELFGDLHGQFIPGEDLMPTFGYSQDYLTSPPGD